MNDKKRTNIDEYSDDLKKALTYSISIMVIMWLLSIFVIK